MNADFANIHELFGNNVQYRIPLFQRRYVWNRDQWLPLWMDIRDKALTNEGAVGEQRKKHFTGAIVIRSLTTGPEEVQKFEIIDGQQRLTTFQIILCVLRDICRPINSKVADAADRYIQNRGLVEDTSEFSLLPVSVSDEQDRSDEQYKLIPTQADRESLKSVVDDTIDPSNTAYSYFKGEILGYVRGTKIDLRKILVLYHTILYDFDVVQIQIDSNDESEKIFESLNARGRKLGELDHLRNNLFLRSARALDGEERNRLYIDYWKGFETDKQPGTNKNYWEREVQENGEKITLFELFFRHFLMAKLGIDSIKLGAFDIYQRQYLPTLAEGTPVETEFSELKKYAEVYQKMVDFKNSSKISLRMEFYRGFGITSLRPFMLFVINELEMDEDQNDLDSFFDILESYTMRRLLCSGKDGVRACNIVFSRLNEFFSRYCNFSGIKDFSSEDLVRWLSDQDSVFYKWPTDDEVKSALQGGWAEKGGEPKIIRYVLYQIELTRQGKNSLTEESSFPFDQFTLEHIMPENWTDKWPLPVNDAFVGYEDLFSDTYKEDNLEWESKPSRDGLLSNDYSEAFDTALEREKLVQSIGNLTIITGPHNSRLSNRPFSKKRKSFDRNSQLHLNQEIAHRYDSWDVKEISERSDELFKDFCKKWKSAEKSAKFVAAPLLMSDKMLQLEAYGTVLITYEGPLKLAQILKVCPYELIGIDVDDCQQTVKKDAVLFACSANSWLALEPHLGIKEDVAEKNLQVIKNPKDRFNVRNSKINSAQRDQIHVTVITRRGHVLHGKVEFFDLYAIYMQVYGQPVIVYRHGLYNFLTEPN